MSSCSKTSHTPKKAIKSKKPQKATNSNSHADTILVRAHTVRAHVRKRSTIKKKRMLKRMLTKPIAASIKKLVKNDDDDTASEWMQEDLEMALQLSMELHQKQATQKELRAKLISIQNQISSSNTQPTMKQQAIMASLAAQYQALITSNPSSTKTTIKKECSICITAIGTLIPARQLKCKHTFHHHCIEQWINTNPSCPQCRCPID